MEECLCYCHSLSESVDLFIGAQRPIGTGDKRLYIKNQPCAFIQLSKSCVITVPQMSGTKSFYFTYLKTGTYDTYYR
jgi:hypothetical protein